MTASSEFNSRTDACAALVTPEGRGAVATVTLRGDVALLEHPNRPLFRAANGLKLSKQPLGRLVYGWWGTKTAEEVVLCRTEAQSMEIHCHGGRAAARRILDDLKSCDVSIMPAAALVENLVGTIRRECLEALSLAPTARTADMLLEQANGLLDATVQRMAVALESENAAVIPGEIRAALTSLVRWAEFGSHLTQPWRVGVCGRPNVGKSSLINAMVGFERSIVFDQPGTTRDVVTSISALEGWPVEFVDTAGIRDTDDLLESEGITRAKRALADADCRVLLLDVSRPLNTEDAELLATVDNPLLVAHKCDLPAMWSEQDVRDYRPGWESGAQFEIVSVSAKSGSGVDALQRRIVSRLVPEVPPPRTPLPVNDRQIQLLSSALSELDRSEPTALRSLLSELCGVPAENSDF